MVCHTILYEAKHITAIMLSALSQVEATLYVRTHETSIQCDQKKVTIAIKMDHSVCSDAI